MFHKHNYKIIAKTYSPPHNLPKLEAQGLGMDELQNFIEKAMSGVTTILWECQDKSCQKLRKEEMLGKENTI